MTGARGRPRPQGQRLRANQKVMRVRLSLDEYLIVDALANKHERSMNWVLRSLVRKAGPR